MVTWPWSRKKWYAGVICGRCGGYVQWVEDPSRGNVKLISEPGAKISLTCRSCGLAATYMFDKIVSFPEGAPPPKRA